MSKPASLHNMLDLSTAHLPNSSPDFGNYRVAKHAYGYVLFIGDQIRDRPTWLKSIIAAAIEHKCILINFDRDSSEDPSFATYNW